MANAVNYALDFIELHRDGRTRSLPIVSVPLPQFTLFTVTSAFLIRFLVSKLVAKWNVDTKFWLFAYNAFQFGTHSFGFAVSFVLSEFGERYFSCAPLYQKEDDFFPLLVMRTAFLFYCLVLFDFIVFNITSALDESETDFIALTMRTVTVNFGHFALSVFPGGPLFLFVSMALLLRTMEYGHKVLQLTNHSPGTLVLWRKVISFFDVLQNIVLFAQGLWVIETVNCRVPKFVFLIQCFYAFINTLLLFVSQRTSLSALNAIENKKFD